MTYCHVTAQLNRYLREQDEQEAYMEAIEALMELHNCGHEEAVKHYQDAVTEAAIDKWELYNERY